MKRKYEPLFKRKPEAFLKSLPIHRLKAYYQSLQKTVSKALPYNDDWHYEEWDNDAHKEWWENEHKYVMFVKAILKTKLGKFHNGIVV